MEIGLPVQSAVFLSIWIIYTIDHLRDAARLSNPSMERHQFHKGNFKAIVWMLGVMTVAGFVNLYFLPQRVILYGSIGVAVVIFYFIIQQKLLLIGAKELVISIVYSFSMFLYPLTQVKFGSYDWLMLGELMMLALCNLLLISMIEWENDRRDHTASIVSRISTHKIRNIVFSLLGGLFFLASFLIWGEYDPFQLFVLLAAGVLTSIGVFHEHLKKNDQYRWLSDAIFFIPIFL